jgi:hypothetical protein
MSDTTNKPVIFLAFANDRRRHVGYLRNLPDEARRLRDVLQPAQQAGLCEVEVRTNSTADDIFKVFQDPRSTATGSRSSTTADTPTGINCCLESAEGSDRRPPTRVDWRRFSRSSGDCNWCF